MSDQEKLKAALDKLQKKNEKSLRLFWLFSAILMIAIVAIILAIAFFNNKGTIWGVAICASISAVAPLVSAFIKDKQEKHIIQVLTDKLNDPDSLKSKKNKDSLTQDLIKAINE